VAVFGEEGEAEDADAAVAFEAAVVEVSEGGEAAEEAAIAVDAAGVIAVAVAVVEDEEEAEVGTTTVIATAIMVAATEDLLNQEEAMAVVTEEPTKGEVMEVPHRGEVMEPHRGEVTEKAEEVTAQEVEAATKRSRVAAGAATEHLRAAPGAATEHLRAAPHAEDTELATRSQVNTGLLRQGVTNSRLQVIHMGPPVVQPVNTERNPLQAASMGLSKQHHQRALGEATHIANSIALGQLTGHNQPVHQLHTTQRNHHLQGPLGNSNSMVRIEAVHLNRI